MAEQDRHHPEGREPAGPVSHAKEEFDVAAYVRRARGGPCFVCAVVAGDPAYDFEQVVFEDDQHIAFLDRYPTLPGKVLVAPKAHVEHVVRDLDEEAYVRLMRTVRRVALAVEAVVPSERTYVLSLGSGQGNAHLHWHIAPLPPGTPYERQQFHALMTENGVIPWSLRQAADLAERLRAALAGPAGTCLPQVDQAGVDQAGVDQAGVDEEELTGGGVNRVVRVGGTVRRPARRWTPAVRALLDHLAAAGFGGAPRAHGCDGEGREVLDFLPGEVPGYPLPPYAMADEALAGVGVLLRDYHDATVGFAPPEGADWYFSPRGPAEVVCHGDVAPYNCVFREGRPVAFIDFDTAHPGPRVWDVAYAAYRFVPLHDPGRDGSAPGVEEQARRLRLFADAYRLCAEDRGTLTETARARLEHLVAHMRAEAAAGHEAFAAHVAEGHDLLYLTDSAHIARHRALFLKAL
ncbi:HIT domain-containing protein [Microbispora sp. CA-102843]|uniref:HIT domain-containing protein n=1 Tax=Microbispora sp. CA-102843 TaxID=3239952 RepID=UPI003D8C8FD0